MIILGMVKTIILCGQALLPFITVQMIMQVELLLLLNWHVCSGMPNLKTTIIFSFVFPVKNWDYSDQNILPRIRLLIFLLSIT